MHCAAMSPAPRRPASGRRRRKRDVTGTEPRRHSAEECHAGAEKAEPAPRRSASQRVPEALPDSNPGTPVPTTPTNASGTEIEPRHVRGGTPCKDSAGGRTGRVSSGEGRSAGRSARARGPAPRRVLMLHEEGWGPARAEQPARVGYRERICFQSARASQGARGGAGRGGVCQCHGFAVRPRPPTRAALALSAESRAAAQPAQRPLLWTPAGRQTRTSGTQHACPLEGRQP